MLAKNLELKVEMLGLANLYDEKVIVRCLADIGATDVQGNMSDI